MSSDEDHMSGEDSPSQEECGSDEQARDSNEPACRFETFWVYKTLIKSVSISSVNFSWIIFFKIVRHIQRIFPQKHKKKVDLFWNCFYEKRKKKSEKSGKKAKKAKLFEGFWCESDGIPVL